MLKTVPTAIFRADLDDDVVKAADLYVGVRKSGSGAQVANAVRSGPDRKMPREGREFRGEARCNLRRERSRSTFRRISSTRPQCRQKNYARDPPRASPELSRVPRRLQCTSVLWVSGVLIIRWRDKKILCVCVFFFKFSGFLIFGFSDYYYLISFSKFSFLPSLLHSRQQPH